MNEIPFTGFQNKAISSEHASALSKLLFEYSKNNEFEPITEIGCCDQSGLAYISLESVDYDLVYYFCDEAVRYLYTDYDLSEEIFFDTIEEYKEFKSMKIRYENENKQILDF